MKKSLLLSLVLISVCFQLFAAIVPVDHAKQVAVNFFTHETGKSVFQADLVYTAENTNTQGASAANEPTFYIFNINGNEGFIIISAEDLVMPILAYDNTQGFSTTKIAPAVSKWMEGYKTQIVHARYTLSTTSTEVSNKWNETYHNRFGAATRTNVVPPLVKSNWDQDPYVNALCPYDAGARSLTVTGCVATCMAQLMRYWSYPTQGIGYHSYYDDNYGTQSANFGATTYDWANMPYNITRNDTPAAILMYHLGVAVEMSYGTAASGGSGAYVLAAAARDAYANSEYAFVNYFGYDPNTVKGYFRDDYSDADWKNIMKTELDAGRPFQYVGSGSAGGHTWVCDGYDANGMYHMNWGWGGVSNGYFTIDALEPAALGAGGGSGGFYYYHQILAGIQPPAYLIDANLHLGVALAPSANPYTIGDQFTLTATLSNPSGNDFHGAVRASLLTSAGAFIKNIEAIPGQIIPAGTSKQYTFKIDSLSTLPGYYKVGVDYQPSYQNVYSTVIPDSFTNPIILTIAGNQKNIQLISAITGDTLIGANQPFQEFVKLVNNGTRDFSGSVRAALYNSNDSLISTVETIANTTIGANGTIRNFGFSNPGINIVPGEYYLTIETYDISSGAPYWAISNNALYSNPIKIRVVIAPMTADIYEPNNVESSAYTFNPVFIAGTANVNTVGSNTHLGNDNDYYKIQLPAGKTYSITARVNDSQDSRDGHTYTNDMVLSYKNNGAWSASYDNELPSAFISNGGAILFHVSDYFTGTTGTYVLDINITQTGSTSVGIDNTDEKSVTVYPNPASTLININTGILTGKYEMTLVNVLGQTLLTKDVTIQAGQLLTENLSAYDNGLYIIKLKANDVTHEAKVMISK